MSFNKSDISKLAKGSGITLIGSSLGKAVFFLSQILTARFLGVEFFGLYTIGFSVIKLSEILAGVGLKTGGMRFISIYNNKDNSRLKGTLISSASISMLNGAIVGLAVYLLSDKIALHFFHNPDLTRYIKLFALSTPFVSGMNVVSSLLQGFQTTKYAVYSRDIVQPLTNILLIILFHYLGLGLSGMIYAFIFSHLVALFAGIYYSSRLFPDLFNREINSSFEIRKLMQYSMPLFMMGFIGYFITWTDMLMLGYLGTSKDVGIYRAASQLPLTMTLLMFATNSIYAPMAANLYDINEKDRLGNMLKATTRWITYATVPMFIMLIFTSKSLMMIFGEEYVNIGSSVLLILSFSNMFDCLTGNVQVTLNMTSKQKWELMNISGIVILSIILNLLLIPRFGAIGAAVSHCISITFINILRVSEIHYIYKIHPFSKDTTKYLIPSFFSICILLLIRLVIKNEINIFLILINLSVIATIFVLYWLIYFKTLNEIDRYIIEKIKTKFQIFQANI